MPAFKIILTYYSFISEQDAGHRHFIQNTLHWKNPWTLQSRQGLTLGSLLSNMFATMKQIMVWDSNEQSGKICGQDEIHNSFSADVQPLSNLNPTQSAMGMALFVFTLTQITHQTTFQKHKLRQNFNNTNEILGTKDIVIQHRNTNCSFMHKYTNIPQRKGRKRQTLIMNAINKEAEDERLVEVLA